MAMIENTVTVPPSKPHRKTQPVVFISGAMNIDKLPVSALKEIDSIISMNSTILIGDSRGVDAQVQKYLAEKKYDNVIVYFVGPAIRNNRGNWKTKQITGDTANGRDLYILKDSAMAHEADYGLMIWDGLSIKTLNNIKELKNSNKGFHVVLDGAIFDEETVDIVINRHINR
jgi:hypothetical protein